MEYQYTIDDLARICKVSKQSIYHLIRKNKDFINENSRKQQRKIKYNQAVLSMLLDYYGKNQDEEMQETTIDKVDMNAIKEKERKIDELETEIALLKRRIEEIDIERKELIKQNGALILTIQQQQQANLLLLPAATEKKGFFKRLFGK